MALKVFGMGNLGKDAEVKPNDAHPDRVLVRFSLASRGRKVDGKDTPNWHNINAFGKADHWLIDNLKKGATVLLQGGDWQVSKVEDKVYNNINIDLNDIELVKKAAEVEGSATDADAAPAEPSADPFA